MDIFKPIQLFSDWLVFNVLNIKKESALSGALNFFIYDCIKILILLAVIIFAVSLLRAYFPPQKIRKILTRKIPVLSNLSAGLLGIITPFCTCSAIPLFIGLLEAGVPLGVTFSYLISAPMINEVAVILLFALFGFKIAAIYIVSGLVISVVAGFILGKMKLEHLIKSSVWKTKYGVRGVNIKSFNQKLAYAKEFTFNLIRNIYPYILLGVAIGAAIHGYAPENVLSKIAGKANWFAVPIAVLIGVPLYSNAAGILPVIKSLLEKGLPLGTSLAFMMSVTALSLPEMIILKKVMKTKLLAIYVAIVALGIVFTGYLFNLLL